jgi:hypothetical protein
MLKRLADWWRKRQALRLWSVERQLEELRVLVQMDHRWLAHDPVADALTARYLKALDEFWYRQTTEDIRQLRERLGLCPHAARARDRQSRSDEDRRASPAGPEPGRDSGAPKNESEGGSETPAAGGT